MQKIRGLFYLLVVLCCAGTLRADGLPKGFEVGDEVVIIWQVNNVLAGGSTYPYRIEEIDGKWIKMTNLEEKNYLKELGTIPITSASLLIKQNNR